MLRRCFLPGLVLVVVACARDVTTDSSPSDSALRAEVEAAMQRYMVAARRVNADSMAASFATNGELLEPGIPVIASRESIRAFMSSFPGVRVDSATVVADTIEVAKNIAHYWGSYFERLAFPGQPASEQHGRFVIEWVREADGPWLIRRYYRIPLTTSTAPDSARPT